MGRSPNAVTDDARDCLRSYSCKTYYTTHYAYIPFTPSTRARLPSADTRPRRVRRARQHSSPASACAHRRPCLPPRFRVSATSAATTSSSVAACWRAWCLRAPRRPRKSTAPGCSRQEGHSSIICTATRCCRTATKATRTGRTLRKTRRARGTARRSWRLAATDRRRRYTHLGHMYRHSRSIKRPRIAYIEP